MTSPLSPEEPDFGPWEVRSVEAFVGSLLGGAEVIQRPHIVAIDGRSASGKSTLAALVNREVRGSVVVHTDDIPSSGNWLDHNLQTAKDAPPRCSFFDWTEELFTNVLEPARAGQPVRYRPPAWDEWGREDGTIEVLSGCPLLILEGVGAARRELISVIDSVVWVQADLEQAETRGIVRDGGDAAAVSFWNRWMAEEFPFLADQRPWERANVIVCGTSEDHDPIQIVMTRRPL